MGWSIGYDSKWKRDVGYGVPATCDHPGCGELIDRGLAYICGGEPGGGEHGCGLFFCDAHLIIGAMPRQTCDRCTCDGEYFEPTSDTQEWVNHKLTDESWERWRQENPEKVANMKVK